MDRDEIEVGGWLQLVEEAGGDDYVAEARAAGATAAEIADARAARGTTAPASPPAGRRLRAWRHARGPGGQGVEVLTALGGWELFAMGPGAEDAARRLQARGVPEGDHGVAYWD